MVVRLGTEADQIRRALERVARLWLLTFVFGGFLRVPVHVGSRTATVAPLELVLAPLLIRALLQLARGVPSGEGRENLIGTVAVASVTFPFSLLSPPTGWGAGFDWCGIAIGLGLFATGMARLCDARANPSLVARWKRARLWAAASLLTMVAAVVVAVASGLATHRWYIAGWGKLLALPYGVAAIGALFQTSWGTSDTRAWLAQVGASDDVAPEAPTS